VLGGLQGVLGWYMVKSGLVDRPEVSHFRLSAHLLLAFAVAQYTAWLALGLQTAPARVQRASVAVRAAALALTPLLVLQIIYGAFVAGTRAGLFSATFPDVNGEYLPGAFVGAEGVVHSLLHWVPLIHWTHRFLGWLTFFGLLGLGWRLRASALPWLRGPAALLMGLVSLQFLLGALTVILGVPTAIAVAHQGVALLLLTSLTWVLHRCFYGGPASAGAPG
jgi:heme a synthase